MKDLKDGFVSAAVESGGDPSPAALKKVLTDFEAEMTALAATGGDSKVVTAAKRIGTEASKAAAAADPTEAAANPAFEKAAAELTAACNAVGVNLDL